MKKTKRTLLCLMLAVLMVASCAMTAMAVEDTALIDGTLYTYTWSLTRSSTYGTGHMATQGTPAYLTVKVRNYLYSEENDKYGYGAWVSNTGYSGVTTTASNVLVIDKVNVPSQVISTDGRFYIGSKLVTSQNNVV